MAEEKKKERKQRINHDPRVCSVCGRRKVRYKDNNGHRFCRKCAIR